jgi:hypothetical protein
MKRTRGSNLHIGAKEGLRSGEVANYSPPRRVLVHLHHLLSSPQLMMSCFARSLGEEPDPRDLMQPRPAELIRRRSFNSRTNRTGNRMRRRTHSVRWAG